MLNYILTSGNAVIGCSCGLSYGFFLYLRSPNALDILRFPSILPSELIVDPALRILVFSYKTLGL